jgi:hypothetical protein
VFAAAASYTLVVARVALVYTQFHCNAPHHCKAYFITTHTHISQMYHTFCCCVAHAYQLSQLLCCQLLSTVQSSLLLCCNTTLLFKFFKLSYSIKYLRFSTFLYFTTQYELIENVVHLFIFNSCNSRCIRFSTAQQPNMAPRS